MKRKGLKIISRCMALTMLIATISMPVSSAYAIDTTTNDIETDTDLVREGYEVVGEIDDIDLSDFKPVKEEIISISEEDIDLLEPLTESSTNINSRSLTGLIGPISGYTKKGSTVKRSRSQNIKDLTSAYKYIALVSGLPYGSVVKTVGKAASGLISKSCYQQYYSRICYENSRGDMYYYRYNYYKNNTYSSSAYITKSYSHVYGKWA